MLSAVVSGHDPDGEAVTFSYRWLRNGVAIDGATGASLDLAEPGHGGKGDDIEVVVTPTDPRATGAPLRSAPVTVVNSVPVVDTVTIDNSTPRTQDVLTARATSLDADGDAVTYAYQWRVSGTDVPGATDSTFDLGPAGHGDKGDRVAVRVVAADASSQSAPATSAGVTVGNTPPVLPPIPDQTSTAGNTVSLSKVASDADGDALYYSATGLPTGLSIDAGTGLISGTAGNDFGPHPVVVTVTDGTDFDSRELNWTVQQGVDARPPEAPKALEGQVTSTTAIDLAWAANLEPDLARYTVYRATSGTRPLQHTGHPARWDFEVPRRRRTGRSSVLQGDSH